MKLSVSSQLHLESFLLSNQKVFSLSTAFRAEKQNTRRHLSEFIMLEAEVSFIENILDLAAILQNLILDTLHKVEKDVADELFEIRRFLNYKYNQPEKFQIICYQEAIKIIERESHSNHDLSYEEEEELVNQLDGPVFVTNYPRLLKPFYMKQSEEEEFASCFDLIFPKVGEIAGGSLRENSLERLKNHMNEKGLDCKKYEWYLEMRKYGLPPHGGFGLGVDRLLQFLTGFPNIRDVIPFPRTYKTINA